MLYIVAIFMVKQGVNTYSEGILAVLGTKLAKQPDINWDKSFKIFYTYTKVIMKIKKCTQRK